MVRVSSEVQGFAASLAWPPGPEAASPTGLEAQVPTYLASHLSGVLTQAPSHFLGACGAIHMFLLVCCDQ